MLNQWMLFFFFFLIIGSCSSWSILLERIFKILNNNKEKETNQDFQLIYPDTKWCGTGNIAMDYEDLGSEIETDKCCRSHDHCIDHIAAGETKHNLTNTAFYSRLHCACDEEFRRCLRLAETETSRKVKEIYFKILKTQCYKKEYPIIGCKYHQWLSGRCLEYELDTNGEQFHQWFDVIDEE